MRLITNIPNTIIPGVQVCQGNLWTICTKSPIPLPRGGSPDIVGEDVFDCMLGLVRHFPEGLQHSDDPKSYPMEGHFPRQHKDPCLSTMEHYPALIISLYNLKYVRSTTSLTSTVTGLQSVLVLRLSCSLLIPTIWKSRWCQQQLRDRPDRRVSRCSAAIPGALLRTPH